MNALMQFLQTTFGPLVLIFTVSNLAAMGLQVRMPEVVVALRNKKYMALIFLWGLGVRAGVRLSDHRVLPLAEPSGICRSAQRAYYATRILLQNGFKVKKVSGGALSRAMRLISELPNLNE